MNPPTYRALDLLDRHGPQLFRLLYRLTLSHDAAEDLLQELMCMLLKSEACWTAENPTAYASRMAMNLAFQWRRRNERALTTQPSPTAEAVASPLQTVLRQEEVELALRALSDLSELTRECLVLRYLQAESPDSIARLLGKTSAQVRAICSKGLCELRKRLDAESLDGVRIKNG